jgi:hypothetical protein
VTDESHARNGDGTDRRTFLKGTAAAVGAGALSTGAAVGVTADEGEAGESVPEPAEASVRHGPHTGRPPSRGERGMVATPHYLASAAGMDVLRSGGSAVDGAIAANAVLSVAYPHMAGLGGDAFWLIHDGDDIRALNASGPAAADATRERYSGYDELPDRGPESAITVPGAVDGWRVAHEAYGELGWSGLFDDAIHHAREGVPVGHSLADWLEIDEPILEHYSETAETSCPTANVPRRATDWSSRRSRAPLKRSRPKERVGASTRDRWPRSSPRRKGRRSRRPTSPSSRPSGSNRSRRPTGATPRTTSRRTPRASRPCRY